MSAMDELVFAAQQSDIKQEEERLRREAQEAAAWKAKHKAPGSYTASELLEKMYGSSAEGVTQKLNAPTPEKKPEERKPDAVAKFPPPPTGKQR